MPDAAELLVIMLLAAGAAAVAAWPLLRSRTGPAASADDREELALRHRLALDALRDVEADRRAGSLDASAYAAARDEAEGAAAATLAALEAAPEPSAARLRRPSGRLLALAAGVLGVAVLGGAFLPPPVGLANRTLDPRADRLADAAARFAANNRDPQAISDLADAYAAGDTFADQQRAAAALLLLINLQPKNASAYARLATAYLRTADYTDATSTLDALASTSPGSADLPFLRGLVARAQGNTREAQRQFALFLAAAPADPRAAMVRGLLAEASVSPLASPAATP